MHNKIKKNIIFESKRLEFLELEVSYELFLIYLLTDVEDMKYIPGKYDNATDIRTMIRHLNEDSKLSDRTSFFFIVNDKEKNIPVGIVNIKIQKIDNYRHGILGYIIKREYSGNGYATEASRRMIEYGFKILDLHEISASTVVANKKSENILKKIKMNKEKIIKNGIIIKEKHFDEVKYSLTSPYIKR